MKRAARAAVVAIYVVASSWVSTASALGDAGAAQRSFAQTQFKRGKALYATHDYAAALAAFRAGFERYPLRGFLINIGQCHRRLGEFGQSAEAYRQFLSGAGTSEALRREVNEALAEVESHLVEHHPTSEVTPVVEDLVQAESIPVPSPPAVESPGVREPVVVVERVPISAAPKKRRWVWAVVGVSVALVVAGAVTAGVVLGTRDSATSGGSLGTLDGRTR